MNNSNELLDYFNQPIQIDSVLLVAVKDRIKVCRIIKFNDRTLVVKEIDSYKPRTHRINPINSIILQGEELLLFKLRGFKSE
jgi:hypothetical protein